MQAMSASHSITINPPKSPEKLIASNKLPWGFVVNRKNTPIMKFEICRHEQLESSSRVKFLSLWNESFCPPKARGIYDLEGYCFDLLVLDGERLKLSDKLLDSFKKGIHGDPHDNKVYVLIKNQEKKESPRGSRDNRVWGCISSTQAFQALKKVQAAHPKWLSDHQITSFCSEIQQFESIPSIRKLMRIRFEATFLSKQEFNPIFDALMKQISKNLLNFQTESVRNLKYFALWSLSKPVGALPVALPVSLPAQTFTSPYLFFQAHGRLVIKTIKEIARKRILWGNHKADSDYFKNNPLVYKQTLFYMLPKAFPKVVPIEVMWNIFKSAEEN